MRGATDRRGQRQLPDVISIRAPHAGSDSAMISDIHRGIKFQSALPLRGATAKFATMPLATVFQSALPLRGTTGAKPHPGEVQPGFQSALPLRGATPRACEASRGVRYFNPRSPCGERPGATSSRLRRRQIFQSALPLRGATRRRIRKKARNRHFNPRSPCGERRQAAGPSRQAI